jgi:hypothetical protein
MSDSHAVLAWLVVQAHQGRTHTFRKAEPGHAEITDGGEMTAPMISGSEQ